MASSEAPVPTLRQGIRIAPPDGSITVEEVLLAIGNQVGHENLLVASRMNKAVVVFLKAERIVNDLVESGVVIRDLFVQVSPLSAPSTRVIVSGVPPFIPNALLENELRKFGKFASGFKTVNLGCKDPKLKHVQSLRRQVFMFLDSSTQTLDVSFRVKHGDGSYMLYASSGNMKCFECGDVGHKRLACPHKQQAVNAAGPQSATAVVGNASGDATAEALVGSAVDAAVEVAVGPVACPLDESGNTAAMQSVLNHYGDNGDVERDVQSVSVVQQETPVITDAQDCSQPGVTDEALQLLTTTSVARKNWEGVREKVCARLSKWKWLLPQMSYRGRVLVSNNLVASTLWHKLTAMTPPSGLIEDIQKIIVDFFWSGRHWVRAAVLYLPVAEGGQGLIDIHSKIASFRLYTAQKLLYGCGSRWLDTSRLLLRRVGRFGYDKHLFFLRAEEVDFAGLTSFYYSVLQAWQVFKIERVNNDTPGMWVFEEPLFFNNFIRTQTLQSTSLRTSFREAGCTKVRHLMKMSRPSLTTLREATGIRSIRLLEQVMEEVLAALPKSLRVFVEQSALPDQWNDDCEYSFPSLLILPAAGEWQEGEGQILSFKIPQLSTFQGAGKKVIYQICVKVLNLRSLTGVKESRWTGFLGQDDSPKGSWRCLYKLPIEKRTADLQWRIVHGAIATNRYRARLDPSLGDQCVFFSQTETLEHLFIECPRLSAMFDLLRMWFQGFGEVFSFSLFIFGPKYCVKKRAVHILMNWLSGSAKLAIWLTRRNQTQDTGSVQLVPVLKGLLKARLRVEFVYHRMIDDMLTFGHRWAVGNVLCTVVEETGELIVNF
ncbi:hypothetical protein Q8A73_022289 [Channa argus]|nr:hypothetical protein Q8A73_022289 [Channa argus]